MSTDFNYQSICDDLVTAGHIDSENIWLPDNGEDEFEKNHTNDFFYYTQNALLRDYADYAISPARFCYVNNDKLDAEAIYSNDCFSILINIGVIRNLRYLFEDNVAEDDFLQTLMGSVYTIDSSPDLFLQKIALIFIMEHERAHLAQFSQQLKLDEAEYYATNGNSTNYKKRKRTRKEAAEGPDEFDFLNHLLEMDADLCGVSYIGSYILTRLEEKSGEVPYEQFHELFAIGLASIMVLFHYWFHDSGPAPIYYKEDTHPHPVIRKAYCWEHFLMILDNNEKRIGFTVDINRIQEKSHLIESKILELNNYSSLDPEVIRREAKGIREYLFTLSEGLGNAKETFQFKYRQEQQRN